MPPRISSLFVSEVSDNEERDDNVSNERIEDSTVVNEEVEEPLANFDDDDDPVVDEIPIFLNTTLSEDIYILEYPGRSSKRPYVDINNCGILDSRIKPKSGVVQVDIPIDIERFYDKKEGEAWGNLDVQTQTGVINHYDGTHYVGVMNKDGLHMAPVNGAALLRPSFGYIDKELHETREINRTVNAATAVKKDVQAIHMTAKSSNDTAPRLGGALRSQRRQDEEEFVGMDWYDRDATESFEKAKSLLADNNEYADLGVTKESVLLKIMEDKWL